MNAFQSVRPRGPDAPVQSAPQKTRRANDQVLNIKGQRQARLISRPNPDIAALAQWKDGTDRTRKISKATI